MEKSDNISNFEFTSLIVGDELGLIKKLEINNLSNELKSPKVNIVNRDLIDQPSPDKAVLTIRRFNEPFNLNNVFNPIDFYNDLFLICSKTNRLQIYNVQNDNFFDIIPQKNNFKLCGSIPFRKNSVINCYENGTINLQNIEKEMIQFSNNSNDKALKILGLDKNLSENIFQKSNKITLDSNRVNKKNTKREVFKNNDEDLPKKKKKISHENLLHDFQIYNPNFNTSITTLDCFELEKNYLAIGGKNNNLKIFDIETENCIFNVKNTESNWLGLNRSTWVSGISWLGKYPSSLVSVIFRDEPVIKLFDIRSNTKPVMAFNMKEKSTYHPNPPVFTKICSTRSIFTENDNSHQLIVGSTIGRMILIDARINSQRYQTLCSFKGFSGSIRDIKHIPVSNKKSKIVSCCLDRFVRIHNFENGYDKIRELAGKYYLKTKLTCIQPVFTNLTKTKQN